MSQGRRVSRCGCRIDVGDVCVMLCWQGVCDECVSCAYIGGVGSRLSRKCGCQCGGGGVDVGEIVRVVFVWLIAGG